MPNASGKSKEDPMDDRIENVAEATEFELFGFNLPVKNAVMAFAFTLISGSAGAIWAAADFMNRLEGMEEAVAEAQETAESVNAEYRTFKEEVQENVGKMATAIANTQQALADNNVSQLQGNLATLTTQLNKMTEDQREVIDLREKVQRVLETNAQVQPLVNSFDARVRGVEQENKKIMREVDDLWRGMDAVSSPL